MSLRMNHGLAFRRFLFCSRGSRDPIEEFRVDTLMADAGDGASIHASIRPSAVWRDTQGRQIQAHAGGIVYYHRAWYWSGKIALSALILPGDMWPAIPPETRLTGSLAARFSLPIPRRH